MNMHYTPSDFLDIHFRCDCCGTDMDTNMNCCEYPYALAIPYFIGLPEGFKVAEGYPSEYDTPFVISNGTQSFQITRDSSGWGDEVEELF